MNQTQHTPKKLWLSALCLALVAPLICQCTLLAQECHGIQTNLVRLHILANSNSEQDQALKLKVRDSLLAYGEELFMGNTTKEQAVQRMESQLETLTRIAQETLQKEGCSLPVTCRLEETYFNTRVYDTLTLPAGTYTALRVLIGEGAGQNWWCVMFPPLCVTAAAEFTQTPDSLNQVLTPAQRDLVTNAPQYQIKFKTVEWVEQAKAWLGL